jgi:hypothetical protein
MKSISRRSFIVAGAALVSAGGVSAAEAATGSIAFKIFRAGFIVGVGGGSGSLIFAGSRYPLSVGGVSLGATIGVAGAELIGQAYHLNDVHDIEGVYSAVGAGLAVAGGGAVAELSNARGVLLKLRGKRVGFMFSLDLGGLNISLK